MMTEIEGELFGIESTDTSSRPFQGVWFTERVGAKND
jgi:hypothetical protein